MTSLLRRFIVSWGSDLIGSLTGLSVPLLPKPRTI
jgi:hypothetical protein